MSQFVRLVSLVIVFGFATPTAADVKPTLAPTSWEGLIRTGDDFYEVKLEQLCEPALCEMTMVVYGSGGPLVGALVHVTPAGGELAIGADRYPIDSETSRRWYGQLRALSICSDGRLEQTEDPPGCRSPDLVEFAEGLAGKIEETRAGPTEIRFFSLDEWPNPQGELVTLGLRRIDLEREDAP